MAGDELFEELPERAKPQSEAAPPGAPRLREPERDQIELRAMDIDSLIGEDHLARVIWTYVVGLRAHEVRLVPGLPTAWARFALPPLHMPRFYRLAVVSPLKRNFCTR